MAEMERFAGGLEAMNMIGSAVVVILKRVVG